LSNGTLFYYHNQQKCVLASNQSFVSSWLVQPIKELSSVAELCAAEGAVH